MLVFSHPVTGKTATALELVLSFISLKEERLFLNKARFLEGSAICNSRSASLQA